MFDGTDSPTVVPSAIPARSILHNPYNNQAKLPTHTQMRTIEINTEIDLMFECPGIPLSQEKLFTKIIWRLRPKKDRTSTFVNLDRIRCSFQEIPNYTPSDEMIWK
jgi:hypothetical protein